MNIFVLIFAGIIELLSAIHQHISALAPWHINL